MSDEAPPADEAPPTHEQPQGVPGHIVVLCMALLFLVMLALRWVGYTFMDHFVAQRQEANRVRCAENLRAIGLAAQAYATDQRTFPHLGKPLELDGDVSTDAGSRVWRKLLALDYLADPARYVCPAKPRIRGKDPQLEARQRWLASGEGQAPALSEARELSYGWTRRSLTPTSKGTRLLAADKGVVPRKGKDGPVKGNHTQGWSLLQVDGSVRFLSVNEDPFPGSWLAKTKDPERDGFLGIRDQDTPRDFGRAD